MYGIPSYFTYPTSDYPRYISSFYYYEPYPLWPRDYPPVNTKILSHSITAYPKLLHDASLVLNKLGNAQIAQQLMANAQNGNQKEVDHIVRSFGLESVVATRYTPSSVQFTINPHAEGKPCCTLTMSLQWGE
ncbi:hypothetical protein [Paenibacillus sp. N3.4]|uniref:hypothetical protein n=1 Tax=Paenibacillus sp. N3.4 TaxID=2603222 RepID=UPI0011C7151B|nr:hypothetical protein [Paenibacillus sp. N3.4]TXK76107.1 hypothetical protein FU659_26285 [Paenibacillus sp. N3.4]